MLQRYVIDLSLYTFRLETFFCNFQNFPPKSTFFDKKKVVSIFFTIFVAYKLRTTVMPVDKQVLLRYQVLNKCFRNKYREYTIDDLVDECNKALRKADKAEVSKRSVQNDINILEADYGIVLNEKLKRGRQRLYRYADTDYNLPLFRMNDEERNKIEDAIYVLRQFEGEPLYDWVRTILMQVEGGLFEENTSPVVSFQSNIDLKGLEHFSKLLQAILTRRVLKLSYTPYGKDTITAYQVYFALYQQLIGDNDQEHYSELFDPDFFDLIIVDECHRGSAKEDSRWRRILEYFTNATQIGMTATPKETMYVSNIEYFGKPVYEYSLKTGIEDGFLAPFRVLGMTMNISDGWRPYKGQLDYYGNEIEDRIYNNRDFDYSIILAAGIRMWSCL